MDSSTVLLRAQARLCNFADGAHHPSTLYPAECSAVRRPVFVDDLLFERDSCGTSSMLMLFHNSMYFPLKTR